MPLHYRKTKWFVPIMSIKQSLGSFIAQWAKGHAGREHLLDRATQYAHLVRLDRPIGIFLVLWPTLWALWIAAEGLPNPLVLFVFISGAVLMRSAGCAINDYADRDFDPHVWRTQQRPIASGKVSPKEALLVFAALCLIAFALVLLMNRLTVLLSFAAAGLAALYPFMKRLTFMPQVFLGAAFSMAIPMAFAAQTNNVPTIAWLLFVCNLVWTVAYDTMYAMADREDDLKIGVKSTAILFGEGDVLITMSLQGMFMLGLYFVGQRLQLSPYFYLGLIAASVFMAYQYTLIQTREPLKCLKAFLNNNYVGMSVFAGLALHYILQ